MADHFARLGLPRRFALDAAELERAYLAHSRLAHPDYQSGAADPHAVQATAAEVNDARATLRDPLRRGEHLLALLGGPPAGAAPQSPAFLMELMEARERLEVGEAAAVDAELVASESSELANLGANLDSGSPSLAEARASLDKLKTLASLRREANVLLNS